MVDGCCDELSLLEFIDRASAFEKTYLLLRVIMKRARRDGFVKEVIFFCGYKVPLLSRNLFCQVDNS